MKNEYQLTSRSVEEDSGILRLTQAIALVRQSAEKFTIYKPHSKQSLFEKATGISESLVAEIWG
jgi:hypothetical protein